MSQAVDGVSQPTLRVKQIHMEAEEEEQPTNSLPELLRLVRFSRPQVLEETAKAWVYEVVRSHSEVGTCFGQGHGHAVHAPVPDDNEERGGCVALANRNVQPRAQDAVVTYPFALVQPSRSVTGRLSASDQGPDQLRTCDKDLGGGPQDDAHAFGRRDRFLAIKAQCQWSDQFEDGGAALDLQSPGARAESPHEVRKPFVGVPPPANHRVEFQRTVASLPHYLPDAWAMAQESMTAPSIVLRIPIRCGELAEDVAHLHGRLI